MKLRVYVRRWQGANSHQEFCECGCGGSFPSSSIVAVPTKNSDHPYEYIYMGHLKQVVGRAENEKSVS